LSAPGETLDAELLKLGETGDRQSRAKHASRTIGSSGWREGVETRRAAPKARERVTVKV
jgi:hypothetical protein